MRIAVMQPYVFPYIAYWQLINMVDIFVIYDDVNFIKRGFINRNNLLERNQPKLFTLELLGASQNKKINEIEIGGNKQKIIKTIKYNYSKAPYFKEVFSLINMIFDSPTKNLSVFIGDSLEIISKHLGINTRFVYSSSLDNNKRLEAQDRLIEISKMLRAQEYINTIGGIDLYNKNEFKEQDIDLSFIKTECFEYKQFSDNYVPNLSIIDVMMFNSKQEVSKMLDRYILI
jgi:hypothetical protein